MTINAGLQLGPCVLCMEPFDSPEDLNSVDGLSNARPLRFAGAWAHASCIEQARAPQTHVGMGEICYGERCPEHPYGI